MCPSRTSHETHQIWARSLKSRGTVVIKELCAHLQQYHTCPTTTDSGKQQNKTPTPPDFPKTGVPLALAGTLTY